jgi:hypothetical protein
MRRAKHHGHLMFALSVQHALAIQQHAGASHSCNASLLLIFAPPVHMPLPISAVLGTVGRWHAHLCLIQHMAVPCLCFDYRRPCKKLVNYDHCYQKTNNIALLKILHSGFVDSWFIESWSNSLFNRYVAVLVCQTLPELRYLRNLRCCESESALPQLKISSEVVFNNDLHVSALSQDNSRSRSRLDLSLPVSLDLSTVTYSIIIS